MTQVVKDISQRRCKRRSSAEKIRIVLEGLHGESSLAETCRPGRIATRLDYSWLKEWLEAGKKRLAGDTARQATNLEVNELRAEAAALEEAFADAAFENRRMKEICSGIGAMTHEGSRVQETGDRPAR